MKIIKILSVFALILFFVNSSDGAIIIAGKVKEVSHIGNSTVVKCKRPYTRVCVIIHDISTVFTVVINDGKDTTIKGSHLDIREHEDETHVLISD